MYLIFFYVNINIGDCMLVRLGYVAISTAIDVTSSSPYTYSEYLNKCNIDKLDDVIKSNLLGLEEILKYNVKNNIHFYRMSSKIIPLATKDDVKFNYTTKYKNIIIELVKLLMIIIWEWIFILINSVYLIVLIKMLLKTLLIF